MFLLLIFPDIKGPESTGMQVTEVDVNKQEIVTAIGLESMTEVWTNEAIIWP